MPIIKLKTRVLGNKKTRVLATRKNAWGRWMGQNPLLDDYIVLKKEKNKELKQGENRWNNPANLPTIP